MCITVNYLMFFYNNTIIIKISFLPHKNIPKTYSMKLTETDV